MNTPLLSKATVLLFAALPVLFASESLAQDDYFRHHPWPLYSKPAVARPERSRTQRMPLFTASTHADTASFTPYPSSLAGVIVGNAQWIDVDNDGDLDIFVSGYDGSAPVAKLYRNDSGNFVEVDAGIPPVITERGVAWGDCDNDGDFDLAITGTLDSAGTMPVSRIYRNDNGTFVDIGAPLMPLLGGVATWVDYNQDGRLDLLIAGSHNRGSTFYTKLYRNDDSTFTDTEIYFPGVWGASVDWGDYDNDGDPDLLLTGYGDWGVTSALFRNDGETFATIGLPFEPVNFSAVSWGDYDNDGRLDFVVSGDTPGWEGSNTYTALFHSLPDGSFEFVPTTLPQLNGCAVAWGDYDNDGDLDLALNGWHDDSLNVTKIFRNDGGGHFTDIGADLPGTWWGSVAWGDVDNDGRLDLLISGGTGLQPFAAFYYNFVPWEPFYPITAIYHNNLPGTNAPPSPPSNLTAEFDEGRAVFSWGASSDDRTPTPMLSYSLRVGTSPGASDIVAPTANLTTGYRRVPKAGNSGHKIIRTLTLPPGTYFWSVQAVDNGYRGSRFAEGPTRVEINTRWQLVSVPYDVPDKHCSVLYPTAHSNAFAFQAPGYVLRDLLNNGEGYWLRFMLGETPTVSAVGSPISSLAVPVKAGWNLIGSLSTPVETRLVESDPPGMKTSQFFGYDGRYIISDSLKPGKGYWVKASEDGTLFLTAPAASLSLRERIQITPGTEEPPLPPGVEPFATGPPKLPAEYSLQQNYPNPFNPQTRIAYTLPRDGPVTVAVYNTLGELIATPVSGVQSAGYKSVEFDARELPSGVYFVRLLAGSFTEVKKMVLAR